MTSNREFLIFGLLRTIELEYFWQPITGGESKGETLEEAALIEVYKKQVLQNQYISLI